MTKANQDRERLIEAAVSAYRERDLEGHIVPSAAWLDLPPAGREEAYARQILSRRLEQAIDPNGLSTTARDVLARIRGAAQGEAEPR